MKKKKLIALCITSHVTFIFLQIYNHTQLIGYTYTRQKYEKKRDALQEKKQILTYQLCEYKNPETIKQFACNNLRMRPTTLKQIKQITSL